MNILTNLVRQQPWLYRALDQVRWNLGHEAPCELPLGGGVILGANRYSHIEQSIKRGEFERGRLEQFATWVQGFERFVDVGANVGLYSLIAARQGVPTLAFEPDAHSLGRLEENIRRNRLADLIEVQRTALGDRAGTVTLHRPLTHNRGMASVNAHTAVDNATEEVPLATLDSWSLPAGARTLLKCDIEGAELAMLAGARGTLTAWTDALVLVEAHRCYGVDPREVGRALQDGGFERLVWFDDETHTWDDCPAATGDQQLVVAGKGRCADLVPAPGPRP